MLWRFKGVWRPIYTIATLLGFLVSYPPILWGAEGDRKWRFPAEGTVGSITSSPAVGPDGTVYVGATDGNLYAIHPNGTRKWQFATGGEVTSSPAVHYDDETVTILVGSSDGRLYAFASDGTQKWEFEDQARITSSPAVSDQGIVYIGTQNNRVHAIRVSDGTAVGGEWPFITDGWVTSSPAIDSEGNIYVGCHDHKVYALRSTGKKIWEFETGDVVSASPALYENGDVKIVCVGSENGRVYALDMADGTRKWEFTIGSPVVSSPAIEGTTVYVGANDANLYAVNLTDGTQTWVFLDADGQIRSSPAVGSDGALYVGSDDTYLYAVNVSNGAMKWRLGTGGRIFSSPTIGFGGTVYVGSEDGILYAVESSSARLKNTAWPKFGHDVRHAARNTDNQGPTADAGTDQTVKSGDGVTLVGSGSFDPDYGIPLYSWTQTDGPSVALSDATAVSPTFTAPGVEEETVLNFELKVTDNGDKTSTDTVTVTVQKKDKDDDDKGCFISTLR
jgi:outer membrane protein assembly factor BamB